jgi:hypothetical protein
MKVYLLITALILSSAFVGNAQKSNHFEIEDFSKLLQPVPKQAVLKKDGYYVWGGSVVKDKKGKYHMYYSRWKKEYGFDAWVTHSEIAHAVADEASGPFKFKDIALPARDKKYWDGLTTHNPTIHYFNGVYYLYYMGTTGDGKVSKRGLNFTHRNNQRIGVAWSKSPNGPWKRMDTPVLDVSKNKTDDDALMVSNPSITQMADGKILMIYKAVGLENKLPFGGPVTHQAAIAESPKGPFKKIKKRIFYKEGVHFPAEDPYIWYQKNAGKYYAIVKDMKGFFTQKGTSLAFFESNDGLSWEPSKNCLVSILEIPWKHKETQKVGRLERPQVLLENGVPSVLYCAVVDGGNTYNVHIPLKIKEK